jgi:hemolysin III
MHALSVVVGLAACITLAREAGAIADASDWIALSLYAAGLMSMTGCSALYNLTSSTASWKSAFRRLDHAAIFVMIAGTYTPFALIALRGDLGTALLAFVWAVALTGVALKLLCPWRFEQSSIAVYLLLGWTILAVLPSLAAAVPVICLLLLGAGGVLYSLGVVFHLWARLPYHNAVWHGFVLGAAACHYVAVLSLVAGQALVSRHA